MEHAIGEAAGKVWQFLSEHPATPLGEVGKSLKLRETLYWMAVGWLAREGKLEFEGASAAVRVALRPE